MDNLPVSRREVLKVGAGSVVAGLAMMSWPEFVFPGQEAGEEAVPFQNVPRAGQNSLDWESLTADEWITPQDQVFSVQHYGTVCTAMARVVLGSISLTMARCPGVKGHRLARGRPLVPRPRHVRPHGTAE